jgi:hypothetical protein
MSLSNQCKKFRIYLQYEYKYIPSLVVNLFSHCKYSKVLMVGEVYLFLKSYIFKTSLYYCKFTHTLKLLEV